jgi:hypothetical protein
MRSPTSRAKLVLLGVLSLAGFATATAQQAEGGLHPAELRPLTTNQLLVLAREIRRRSEPQLLEAPPEAIAHHRDLLQLPGSGVLRILPRDAFVHAVQKRGGGAFYSFARRDHDYDREPDLCLSGTEYSTGFSGRATGTLVDLGEAPLDQLRETSSGQRFGVDAGTWRLLWTRSSPESYVARASALGAPSRIAAVVGHTYLLRAIIPGKHDILVAFTTVAEDRYGHVLVWRIMKTFEEPGEEARRATMPPFQATLPRELRARVDALALDDLIASAARIREILHQRLVTPPRSVEQRYLREQQSRDVRFARILRRHRYDHVTHKGERGPAYYSFATLQHDFDAEPDLELRTVYRQRQEPVSPTDPASWDEDLSFHTGFYGGTTGVIIDLGAHDLDALDAQSETPPEGVSSEAWDLLRASAGADMRSYDRRWSLRAKALGLDDDAPAVVGHTYLLRAILPGEHDHLVAFRVLEDDGHGHTLAWRLLEERRVQQR